MATGAESGAPVLGLPPIEFAMRRAMMAGAEHIVLLVERISSPLLAATDRLRREGASIDVARTIADAIEFVHPEDRLLLMPASLFVAAPVLEALIGPPGPAILAVDRTVSAPFEIIDADSLWTGCALLDGTILRETAAMVGDWDLGSTLLRRLVQQGARKLVLPPDAFGRDIALFGSNTAAAALGTRLVDASLDMGAEHSASSLSRPLVGALASLAGRGGVRDLWIERGALGVAAGAVVGASAGWVALPALGIVLALLWQRTATVLVRATRTGRSERLSQRIFDASAAVVLFAIGVTLARTTGQWGCALLAGQVIAVQALIASEPPGTTRRWHSDTLSLALLLTLGAVVAQPLAALGLAALWSAVTLLWPRFVAGNHA